MALTAAGERLDCTPSHLAKVLKGERSSSKLKARYEKLVGELEGEGGTAR